MVFLLLNLGASLLKSKSRLEADNAAALRRQLIVLQRKVRGRGPSTKLSSPSLTLGLMSVMSKRRPRSRSRGRRGVPAEGYYVCWFLKHVRNLSYGALEREVRGNLVYRDCTRIGGGKMPDAKTMGRCDVAIGPQVLRVTP
jgi:hypothetical protein